VASADAYVFRILGPLEVLRGQSGIALGPGNERALLAILLLHPNEAVSTDRLTDLLWESPPASASKMIQIYVSRLRRSLGDSGAEQRLETQRGGYRMRVETGELDLERFERLRAQGEEQLAGGDAEQAARTLREALSLWRSRPLAEFGYAPFVHEQSSRLDELQLETLESRIEAELALGRGPELVAELDELVTRHPLRERLVAQLMLALYRAGRQADALDVYRRTRRTLVEELGIEPGHRLKELEQAILRQDRALDAPLRAGRVREGGEEPPDAVGSAHVTRRRLLLAGLAGSGVTLVLLFAVALGDSGGGPGLSKVHGNSVALIDPSTNRIIDEVPVGARPGDVAFGSDAVWVANLDDRTVSRIDAKARRVTRTIPTGGVPAALAAAGDSVWVASPASSHAFVNLRRIDTRYEETATTTRVPSLSYGAAYVAAARGTVWVAPELGLLSRLRANGTIARQIEFGGTPRAVAVGAGSVWLADDLAGTITRIDPVSGVAEATITVGHAPSSLAFGDGALWVADSLDNAVFRVDPESNEVSATVRVGDSPRGLAVGAGAVWVANSRDGTVSRIDPRTNDVTKTIRIGGSPQGIVVAAGKLWVSTQNRVLGPSSPSGGRLRVESQGDFFDTVDPALAFTSPTLQVEYATCAKLLNYPDRAGAAGSQLVPEVAAALPSLSRDGRTYTFRIRRGFRFSPPSNEPVTARTFKDTIERSLSPKVSDLGPAFVGDIIGEPAYEAGKTRHIAGVVARGNQLTIRLKRASPDFPARIALPFFCAVPSGTPLTPGGERVVPSAGPYYVASFTPGQGAVLKKNPNYTGARTRHLSEVDVVLGVGKAESVSDVEAGKADYAADDVPPGIAPRLAAKYGAGSEMARRGGQRYFVHSKLGVIYLAMNTSRPLFADARLRRAVNYAIDRRALARQVTLGGRPTTPTDQYLPPGIPGFRDAGVYPFTPDLGKARSLAGSGRRTAVLYTCNTTPCPQIVQLLTAELKEIGLRLEVREFAIPVLLDRLGRRNGPFDIGFFPRPWVADYPDPDDFLNALLAGPLTKKWSPNLAHFDEPAYNTRLAHAASLSGKRRYLEYGGLDVALARDAAPWAAFGNPARQDFFSARIGCQVYQPLYEMDFAALCVRS
jgi:peptide/nickel transport system substrate-binding protein